jgi:hypothetical protein
VLIGMKFIRRSLRLTSQEAVRDRPLSFIFRPLFEYQWCSIEFRLFISSLIKAKRQDQKLFKGSPTPCRQLSSEPASSFVRQSGVYLTNRTATLLSDFEAG